MGINMVNINDCIASIAQNGELNQTPKYSVTKAAKMLGLSVHTLRYYDSLNLFPFLQRDQNEKRLFSDADLQWAKLIECLRNANMSIKDVQHYVKLCLRGDETLDERLTIINQQEKILIDTITQLNEQLALLKFKKQYYKATHQTINN